jgi:hypothetical protein
MAQSSRAGVAPAEVQRLFTAHCFTNNPQGYLREADTARQVLEPLIYGDNHQCGVVLELRATKIRRLRE